MKQDIAEIAASLNERQIAAMLPGGNLVNKGLIRLGLAMWKHEPFHRTKQLRLTKLGFAVRAHLLAHSYTEKTDG